MGLQDVGDRTKPPVDKGTVSRWESAPPGRISTGALAAFAEAIGVHVTDLYRPPPPKGQPIPPKLDDMADNLDEDAKKATIDFINAMARRRRRAS